MRRRKVSKGDGCFIPPLTCDSVMPQIG